MSTTLTCPTGTLAPYVPSAALPWDRTRAQHLARRIGFGAKPEELEYLTEVPPDVLVDSLIDDMVNQPPLPPPQWANWAYEDYDNFDEQNFELLITWTRTWIRAMLNGGPKEKLTLFWSNHFVTRQEDYFCASWQYQYFQLLEKHALGNFRDFIFEIGATPAMLVFLNGLENNRFSPNENYARELFELFTLGRDNGYTQQDIVEASRALTGYNGWTSYCGPINWVNGLHDNGEKTIFGQTGNFAPYDVVRLIFEERGDLAARFVCEKLYRFYVNPVVDEAIVAGLAETFKNNDWEIAPVLRQLFKSEHFFDPANMGAQVKSPYELMISFFREGDFPISDEMLNWILWSGFNLGQFLFEPPDVAGWPGDRAWIDSSRLTGRWSTLDGFIYTWNGEDPDILRNFVKWLTDDARDPAVITQAVIDHFIPGGLHRDAAYVIATDVLKWEVPQNYYDEGLWNLDWQSAPWQIVHLLRHLVRLPEFQLH